MLDIPIFPIVTSALSALQLESTTEFAMFGRLIIFALWVTVVSLEIESLAAQDYAAGNSKRNHHACATPFQSSADNTTRRLTTENATTEISANRIEERVIAAARSEQVTAAATLTSSNSVAHSDYQARCLPGLNSTSDLSATCEAQPAAHFEPEFSTGLLAELQADGPARNDVVCGPNKGLVGLRLQQLPAAKVVEVPEPSPVVTDVAERAEMTSMLQPIPATDFRTPKHHAASKPQAPVREEVRVMISDDDSTSDLTLPAGEYSSVSEVRAENESITNEFEKESQPLGDPEALISEPELNAGSSSVATSINFSDTPASPIQNSGTQHSYVGSQSSGLLIHPPRIQPYNNKQHTFLLENRGSDLARNVTIEIKVSENARVIAALPDNSVTSSNMVIFKFDEIAAGDNRQLHITAVSADGSAIDFEANVIARSTYDFVAQNPNTNGANLTSVRHQETVTTVAPNAPPSLDGPRLVRNPFVNGAHDQGRQYRQPVQAGQYRPYQQNAGQYR